MCDWSSGVCSSVRFGFADINRDNFDPSIGDDPNFSARGRSERLSYSLDWSALGGDRLRLLAGAEREWTHALTSSAFSSDRGKTAITSFWRSEEHTSELQSLMRSSSALFCLHKKKINSNTK